MRKGMKKAGVAAVLCALVIGATAAVSVFAAKSPTSQDAPRATATRWDDYGSLPTAGYSAYYASTSSGSSSSGSSSFSGSSSSATDKATSGGNRGVSSETIRYRADGTVKVVSISSKSKKVVIGSTVKVYGEKYKVTAVSANAFKNCKNMTALTLPKTINAIGKNAFKGATKLRVIKLNITKAISVAKGAFNGVDSSKMTIRVSKKMSAKEVAKFIKILKKAGYKGKVK